MIFADVAESARLFEANEDNAVRRWLNVVQRIKSGPLSKRNEARLVKTLGDGLLLEVEDATSALQLARELIAVCDAEAETEAGSESIRLRIGVNIGEVVTTGDADIYGHQVNIAHRLLELTEPGEIVVTAQVRDSLVEEIDAEFEDLGECYLRNVKKPVRAFKAHPKGRHPQVKPNLAYDDLMPTVAVVPFAPRDLERDHFALGEVLADEMISGLARSPDINVISRLSTTGFRMRSTPLAEIGKTLSADFLISGTYSAGNRRAALDIEMVEIRSGMVIWSERLEEDLSDLTQPDSPVQYLVGRAHDAIVQRQISRALSSPMPTLESYSLLMGAVSLMHRLSLQEFEIAGQMLQTLIDRTPRQPAPLAARARWHVLRVVQGWSDSAERDAQLALQCTRRALDVDPKNVPALVAEGFALNNLMRRLDDAEQVYDLALEISPNDANARLLRGTLYAFRGEGRRATRDTERAMHLAPLDPHRFFFQALAASACIADEDYDRALLLANQSLRMNRMHTSTLRVKSVAQVRLGLVKEARETAAELMRLQPGLTVGKWLATAPSAAFPVGRDFADSLRTAGVPE